MCFQLRDGVDCDFTDRTMKVSLALLGVLLIVCTWLPICAGFVCMAARLGGRARGLGGVGGLRDLGGARV